MAFASPKCILVEFLNFCTILVLLFHPSSLNSVRRIQTKQLKQLLIQIQGYTPTENDDYVAVSVRATPGYIEKFEPFAHADRVHHMLLYGCSEPAYTGTNFWRGLATCSSGMHILYAWARNAPALQLPENVAFAIGNQHDSVQHLVLQIHYARPFTGKVKDFSGVILHMSENPPKYFAGVYLLLSGEPIPPHLPAFLNNMSCSYTSETELHPFAFRVHTHAMGRINSAYFKSGGKWTEIGKRNPQWPQLFQPIKTSLVIKKGDFIAATCRFDSHDKDKWVPMGSMGVDEMCNFYMMFYWDAKAPDPFPYGAQCFGNENPDLISSEYPVEGTKLLPPHPEWEHKALQSEKPFGVIDREQITSLGGERLGQIAGLAVDSNQRIIIFHRGNRVWNAMTFDINNSLMEKNPISAAVILVGQIDKTSNKLTLVSKYGTNQFYLPHGIFVDESNYYYTTDVGSHQIGKWKVEAGVLKNVWTIGEKFVPGNDYKHFCKPAGIVVSKIDGSVYVADGYCNSRVVKFSKDGEYLMEFGSGSQAYDTSPGLGQFSIPHDIALDEKLHQIYVADRENGRVQVFTDHGDPLFEIKHSNLFSTVYSLTLYEPIGLLFVPGPSQSTQSEGISIYVTLKNSKQIQYSLRPTTDNFQLPHVLRASHGNTIWVGEISESGGVLWRLEIQSSSDKDLAEETASDFHLSSIMGSLANGARITNLSNMSQNNVYIYAIITSLFLFLMFIFYKIYHNNKSGSQETFDRKGFKLLKSLEFEDDLSHDDETSDEFDEVKQQGDKNENSKSTKNTKSRF